ncbi:MAG: Lrp/AsnC family transcriptional regulator for asnA, asnC and gidA [Saprospiraceae bacterium]|jgi:Lrp/AsnC family transcriptional regulator for asnA, asnC and gidA
MQFIIAHVHHNRLIFTGLMAMNQQPKLDQTDLLIITQVLVDAKMSYSELGQSIFVSGGTVHVRLNKL